MTVWVYSICRNEIEILPFYLRHYGKIADRMCIFDDRSDDGTREALEKSEYRQKIVVRETPWRGLDDNEGLRFSQTIYRECIGRTDWVIWADMDEFIYHPNLREELEKRMGRFDVLKTMGYNMTGHGLPKDDGKSQIYDLHQMGVRAPVYSKPVVFDPKFRIGWVRGRHALEHCDPRMEEDPFLKLLHYRYMGYDYTKSRNMRSYDRNVDKGCAWSCTPSWKGEHSPEWAEEAIGNQFDVVNDTTIWK